MSASPTVVVCLSTQRWSDCLWTNKQHVTSRIAKQHRSVYLEYRCDRLRDFLRRKQRANGVGRIRALRHLWSEPIVYRDSGVEVVNFLVPSAVLRLRRTNPLFWSLNFNSRIERLNRWLRSIGIEDPLVLVYHPGYGDRPARISNSGVVYDCVDNYAAFPEFARARAKVRKRERQLCRISNRIICTSRPLYRRIAELAPGKAVCVENVGDFRHFNGGLEAHAGAPDEIRNLSRPIVGFVGAISAYKVNIEWIYALAKSRPGWSIVLVGPIGVADPSTDLSPLYSLHNVHFVGQRPYREIPRYVRAFDVATIPYRDNDYTRYVFPIKFFEYLASGTPVVVSNLPSLADYKELVGVANSAGEFIDECVNALRDDHQARRRRIEVASKNDWSVRTAAILDELVAAGQSARSYRVGTRGTSR